MQSLKENYVARQADFKSREEALHIKYNRYAFVRLAFFLAAFGMALWLGNYHFLFGIGFFMFFLVGFYRFIKWHQNVKTQEKHNKCLSIVNSNEVLALDHNIQQFGNGETFIDPTHSYALDLDVFGPHSFFQYANRTVSTLGRKRLASYLKNTASEAEISLRQEAIRELAPALEWRQNFQAYGMETNDSSEHVKAMEIWLEQPPFVLGNRLYEIGLYAIPIWTLVFLITIAPFYPWYFSLLCLLPAGWLLNKTVQKVNETHNQTSKADEMLANYALIIRHIENHHFDSEKLKLLKQVFFSRNQSASKALKQLSYTISQLNVRYNAFTILLNLGGLWDLQWVYRLEKWKARHREQLLRWFEAMQEFEAVISLSTVYYNNPDWTFPTINDRPELVGDELAHPLIHPNNRIANDFSTPLVGHIKLVTGSNMAGKSTFLRTVGLNIVLAMAGAPVCARSFRLPLINVYTSMRTQDALHESTSSFFAELKRLKFIIDEVGRSQKSDYLPYFLLDEILKGTNSKDRHTGGEALIRQMIKAGGAGIIATHDLELGKLESEYEGRIENLCMEVEIENGELDFDYKLKKGVSQSFNATLLMQNMGIEIQ